MAEYDTFVDNPDTIPDGKVNIAIRELTPKDPRKKYFTRYVEAEIKKLAEGEEAKGDKLRLRWNRGRLHPGTWEIKVLKELGEFMPKQTKAKT
jgi:hypothetical protein